MTTPVLPQKLCTQPLPVGEKVPPSRGHTLPAISPDYADSERVFRPTPPNATPSDLFSVQANRCSLRGYRFIRKGDRQRSQALFFIDGACSNNGAQPGDNRGDARGGAGVVVAPLDWTAPICEPLPLDGAIHTNNRAELRAALVAMSLRRWPGEGFERIVLATDSEYLVLGISEYIRKWRSNGWKTSGGSPVKNKDLWEALYAKLRELEAIGCLVQFWRIPRDWNEADPYAKKAAVIPDARRPKGGITDPVYMLEKGSENKTVIATHALEKSPNSLDFLVYSDRN